MSWFITLIVGAIIGWIVGASMRSSWHTGIYTNILLGMVGAVVGVWFFAFLLGSGTTDTGFGSFQGINLLWDAIGALVVLYVINAVSYWESSASEEKGEMPAYSAGTAHEYRGTRKKFE